MTARAIDSFRRWVVMQAIKLRMRRLDMKQLTLGSCWQGMERCMLVWMGGTLEQARVMIVAGRLRERFPGIRLTLVCSNEAGADWKQAGVGETIVLSKEDFSFWGLPHRAVRDRLMSLGVELTVDLSDYESPLATYICLLSQAGLRLGFSGAAWDEAYNYQVSPGGSQTHLDRYRALARYIG